MDRYSKFILTATAILLLLNLLKPFLVPGEVEARRQVIDVNIVSIDGKVVRYPVEVWIAGSVFVEATRPKDLAMADLASGKEK